MNEHRTGELIRNYCVVYLWLLYADELILLRAVCCMCECALVCIAWERKYLPTSIENNSIGDWIFGNSTHIVQSSATFSPHFPHFQTDFLTFFRAEYYELLLCLEIQFFHSLFRWFYFETNFKNRFTMNLIDVVTSRLHIILRKWIKNVHSAVASLISFRIIDKWVWTFKKNEFFVVIVLRNLLMGF